MYKRILTIQDISCLGQCSLTVALPIISACGHETVIIPSAVLSTHTGGFKNYTFRDLTDDIPLIEKHWNSEGIKFDCIYTGYLGSTKQIDYIKSIFKTTSNSSCIKIVDPAMADNGKLYSGFDMDYVKQMAKFCKQADIIIPNISEACFMTGTEYRESYDESYIHTIFEALSKITDAVIVLTGVSYDDKTTGVAVYKNGTVYYYRHKKYSKGCHGTGDIYASAFTGMLMNGLTEEEAARKAADFTLSCIEKSQGDENHTYGVKFELCLSQLTNC